MRTPFSRIAPLRKHVGVLAAIALLAATARAAQAADISVLDFGAVADGKTDCADAIAKALAAAGKAGGGRVILPAAKQPYLVGRTVRVAQSNVEFLGQGATLKMADTAIASSKSHALHLSGSKTAPIRNVTVRGLTVDANFWNQKNTVPRTRRGKTVQVFLKPRGILVEYAQNALLDKVHVRRAWVSLAFGRGVVNGEARDCTVSQWHNDGFDAAQAARDIRFTRCKAFSARHGANGGLSGRRDGAWEIEEGVRDVTMTDCVVEGTDAIGFKLRSHNTVTVNRNVRFIRCKVLPPSTTGWLILGRDHDTRTVGALLEECETAGGVLCANGAEDVTIKGGRFGSVTLRWPRSAVVEGARMGQVNIWAEETSDGKEAFRPKITLKNVQVSDVPLIIGDKSMVTVVGDIPTRLPGDPKDHFYGETFWSKERFEERALQTKNVRLVIHERKRQGRLEGEGSKDGFVVWRIKRDAPVKQCLVGYYSYVPFREKRRIVFSVSLDDGKTWRDAHVRQPASAAGADVWGGGAVDLSGIVSGKRQFLLKIAFVNGGGRIFSLALSTTP